MLVISVVVNLGLLSPLI